MEAVKMPESLTTISGYAFADCTSLSKVQLSPNVTVIKNYAFKGCTGLKSITIPDSVVKINSNAFADCANLTSASVSAKTKIDKNAFPAHTKINIRKTTQPDKSKKAGK